MGKIKAFGILTGLASVLATAATASVVITFAQTTENTQVPDTEVIATESKDVSTEIISEVSADISGYTEETVDLVIDEETESSEDPTVADPESKEEKKKKTKAIRQIKLAEAEEADTADTVIDVGNEHSNEVLNERKKVELNNPLKLDASDTVTKTEEITVHVSGSTNAEKLWNLCKKMGFTDAGAAAVLGNLYLESSLNPASKSKNFNFSAGTGGGGLAGWMSAGRMKNLMKLANKKGVSWDNLELQMEFLKSELTGGYKKVGNAMKRITDPEEAADYFCVYFEGCIGHSGSPSIDGVSSINGKVYQGLLKRKALAKKYYKLYADK